METEWSGPIAHVGILTELSQVLAGIEASGNVRITADETGIDVDLQDKTINVAASIKDVERIILCSTRRGVRSSALRW